MNKSFNIGFALAKITTEQFAVLDSNFDNDAEINIQANFRFAADKDKKMLAVFAAFIFETNSKQFLIIEAGCHFTIETKSWEGMYELENNKLVIPVGFIRHMAMLTIGTTRGILHAKTDNTIFNQYHLPTVNLQEIIKQDKVFDFNNNE